MNKRSIAGHTTAAIRGPVLTFKGDPFKVGLEHAMVYESDAIVAFGDGIITHFGPANEIKPQLPRDISIRDYGRDALISAGFIDSHVHFPQTPMIGAFGAQLLDWLNTYTFPTEGKFADKDFARSCALWKTSIVRSVKRAEPDGGPSASSCPRRRRAPQEQRGDGGDLFSARRKHLSSQCERSAL